MIRIFKKFIDEHVEDLSQISGQVISSPENCEYSLFHHGRVNEWSKLLCLVTYRNTPLCLIKTVRSAKYSDLITNEYNNQKRALSYFSGIRVPKVLYSDNIEGYEIYAEEIIDGTVLSEEEARGETTKIWNLQKSIPVSTSIPLEKVLTLLHNSVNSSLFKKYFSDLSETTETLRICFTHGDLTYRNIVKIHSNELVLIDWQKSNERPFWGIDFCHYLSRAYSCFCLEDFKKLLLSLPIQFSDGEVRDLEKAFLFDRFFDELEKREHTTYMEVTKALAALGTIITT